MLRLSNCMYCICEVTNLIARHNKGIHTRRANYVEEYLTLTNPLTPNDHYRRRTAPLTSKRCILYIYSTNIGTEYFKLVYTLLFFSLLKVQFVS